MYNKLLKNGTTYAMIVGAVLIAIFALGIIFGDRSVDANGVEAVEVDLGLQMTVVLTILTFLAMVLAVFKDIFLAGRSGLKALMGFIVLIVMFFVLKSMVTVEKGGSWDILYKEYNVTENASSLVSAGIYSCFFFLAISVLVFIYSEIRGLFN